MKGLRIALFLVLVIFLAVIVLRKAPVDSTINDSSGGSEVGTSVSDGSDFGRAPEFTLIDQSGAEFRTAGFQEGLSVVNFFFASCEKICPALNGRISRIYRKYGSDGAVRFLSITVDPDRDNSAVLAEYAKRFEATAPNWRFLTGERATISSIIADGFKLVTHPDVSLHTTRVVLIDRGGNIMGFYQGSDDESVSKLEKDIGALLAKSHN